MPLRQRALGARRLSATGAQDAILPHIPDYSNCNNAPDLVGDSGKGETTMVDLYLMSKTDRGLWLKESLAGSLPGLRVEGAVLEGRASPEGQRFRQNMATGQTGGERYRSVLDYDGVLRGHTGQK